MVFGGLGRGVLADLIGDGTVEERKEMMAEEWRCWVAAADKKTKGRLPAGRGGGKSGKGNRMVMVFLVDGLFWASLLKERLRRESESCGWLSGCGTESEKGEEGESYGG